MKILMCILLVVVGSFFIWMGWAYPQNPYGWSRDWVSLALSILMGLAIYGLSVGLFFSKHETN